MFQNTATKMMVLMFLLVATLGTFWYLDTKFHWEKRILPEPESVIIENEFEPIKNDTTTSNKFVPTDEWQILGDDQPIPPGLHVQVNLETGVKRAKLIDKNENDNTNNLSIVKSNKTDNIEETKAPPVNLHKFKSYEKLKEDLKELNVTIKSDMEVMDDLSIRFKKQMKIYEDSNTNLKSILTDLEYLLHQVDTAEVFVKNQGIESIIIPCINSNSSFLKEQGALLLGSAASNNQKVQIAAVEANTIPLLLKYIDDEYEFLIQKNCIFALSSIIRRFPTAQKKFIENNGIQVFISIFKRPTSDSNIKLRLKVSQLLEDLVIEIDDAKLTFNEEYNTELNAEAKERLNQYNELHLKNILVENGWCQILGNVFISLSNSLPTNEETHDMVEASGKSLLAMGTFCKKELKSNKQLFKSFSTLEEHYKKLFQQDNLYKPLYQLINKLTNTYDPVLE